MGSRMRAGAGAGRRCHGRLRPERLYRWPCPGWFRHVAGRRLSM